MQKASLDRFTVPIDLLHKKDDAGCKNCHTKCFSNVRVGYWHYRRIDWQHIVTDF